jgi:NTP pyrophosphatase (non-canonical NTP hydrolase)
MSNLTLDDYQSRAFSTAVYNGRGSSTWQALAYAGLGAAGEAGEIANKIKKMQRDDGGDLTDERRVQILQEVGGCLWYLAAMCTELGTHLGDVALDNLDILERRSRTGQIWGDGDERGTEDDEQWRLAASDGVTGGPQDRHNEVPHFELPDNE